MTDTNKEAVEGHNRLLTEHQAISAGKGFHASALFARDAVKLIKALAAERDALLDAAFRERKPNPNLDRTRTACMFIMEAQESVRGAVSLYKEYGAERDALQIELEDNAREVCQQGSDIIDLQATVKEMREGMEGGRDALEHALDLLAYDCNQRLGMEGGLRRMKTTLAKHNETPNG